MKFVPKPRSTAGFFTVAARHVIMGLLNGLQKHMWLKPPSALELCGPPHITRARAPIPHSAQLNFRQGSPGLSPAGNFSSSLVTQRHEAFLLESTALISG